MGLAAFVAVIPMGAAQSTAAEASPVGMAADADPAFEVATIKPSVPGEWNLDLTVNGRNFKTRNMSLADLMEFVYGVHARQIAGGPEWVHGDKYDITGVPDTEGKPSEDQWKTMVRKLLAERFQLTFHHEKKELSVYALTLGKGKPKLVKSVSTNPLPHMSYRTVAGGLLFSPSNARMEDLCEFLQVLVLDRPVVDQTGLAGRYDFSFTFMPDESQFRGHPPVAPNDGVSASPGLFTAIREVGLQLEPVKASADVLVIDRVERPSEN